MSKLSEQLRAIRAFNNHDIIRQFGTPDDVVIEYHRPADGRLGWCDTHKTRVWSPYKHPKLDTPLRWGVTGSEKDFHGRRKESLAAALAWASTEFGHTYVPSPHGGYIPKHVLQKAKEAVK